MSWFTLFTFKERCKVKKALVRAEFFALNKLDKCDLFSIMDETEVVRIVESTVLKKNENLLASMKSLFDDSILKRAETFACGHRRFPPQRNQEA